LLCYPLSTFDFSTTSSPQSMASLLCFLPAMLFEKYRARKAATKELRAHADILEKEHEKLCHPMPPSYDELLNTTPNTDASQINIPKPMDTTAAPVHQDFAYGRNSGQNQVVR